jgi:hypothetical protein
MKFTIRQIFILVLFLGLFLMTLRPIADPDFWWHLRTGELIVQTHSIPHIDPFSFTKAGIPWITHEWLSEVLIYGLFHIGGNGMLIFIFSIIITGTFIIAYFRSSTGSRPYMAGFVLLLGAISTAPTWGVRPQMVSLLLTSLFLFLLDCYRRNSKIIFLIPLPLIMLVWVNLHAGYFLGLAIIGIYILGGLIEMLLAEYNIGDKLQNLPAIKNIVILCGTLGTSVLVTLANPNGFQIIIYPFQTLTSPAMQQFIQEWFSPDFHQLIWQPLAWLILALIGMGMVSKKSISPTNILLIVIFGYAALHSMRNIPFFALVAIPVLSDQIGSVIKIPSVIRPLSRRLRLIVSILIAFMVLVVSLRFIQVVQGQSKAEADNFPKTAVDWILQNKPAGNIFNTYGWGGYLIWRTYPEYKVYIDGRADVYGDAFLYDYISIYHAEPGWEAKLNDHSIRTVIVESDSPLANIMRQSPGWRTAFEDKASIIFER